MTTPDPTMTHQNMTNRFHHFLHNTHDISNNHHGNGHFTNHTYQAAQTREHTHYTIWFRMTKTSHEQQGFHNRESPRLDGSFNGTFSCENYNNALHNCYVIVNHMEAVPFGQARGTIYESSLLSSVMIELTMMQTMLSLIDTLYGKK